MYGTGFVLFYFPILSMVNEFWVSRRGMAYGFLCSSSAVSGIVFPFSLEAMLARFGLAVTLRSVGIGLAILTGPLLFLLKGQKQRQRRTDTTTTADGGNEGNEENSPPAANEGTDWGFFRVPLFWIYTASNVMQGFAFFFPSLYLPSYASSIGLTPRMGALVLAVMSLSQFFGQFGFGYLSDRRLIPLNILGLISTLMSAVGILALWGLSRNSAMLCTFAVIYGFFAGGWSSLWARMGTAVTPDSTAAFAVFGLFNFGKGVGNVLAGPISARILVDTVDVGHYGARRFEPIVLFSGSCMAVSTLITIVACFKPWKSAAARL